MDKSLFSLPHIVLTIISLGSYTGIAIMVLWQRTTGVIKPKPIRMLSWAGLIAVFLLVDTGFIMHRMEHIATAALHHPLGLGSLFLAGGASVLCMISKRKQHLLNWAAGLAVATTVSLILTSLFAHGS